MIRFHPAVDRWASRVSFQGLVAMAMLAVAAGGAAGQVQGDFNGDGYADLAIGVPNENVGSVADAGVVHVLYGSATGPTDVGSQFWHQDVAGVLGVVESFDRFGFALASGDFDSDGFADLAIGVPGDLVAGVDGAGAVCVLYGSAAGLSDVRQQLWSQDSPGILDEPEAGDVFGTALAVGDFDGDGFVDLAVGDPGEPGGGNGAAGAVAVIHGSAAGLTDVGNQIWTQDSPGVLEAAEGGDSFGSTLAAGDFDGDGRGDLAIGATLEGLGAAAGAGVVHVLYGTVSGLSDAGNQLWHQDVPGIPEVAELSEVFGNSLAAGDFDGDGADDLAIGCHAQDVGGVDQAGVVHVLYGTATGLSVADNQLWHQEIATVPDGAEAQDGFGFSLKARELTGDGRDDLIVGVVGEDQSTGAIHVFKGTANGLASAKFVKAIVPGNAFFSQFSMSIGAGDYNGDGFPDVAIGSPGFTVGTTGTAGVVTVFAGRKAFPRQFWTQNSPGISDTAEVNDRLGHALN